MQIRLDENQIGSFTVPLDSFPSNSAFYEIFWILFTHSVLVSVHKLYTHVASCFELILGILSCRSVYDTTICFPPLVWPNIKVRNSCCEPSGSCTVDDKSSLNTSVASRKVNRAYDHCFSLSRSPIRIPPWSSFSAIKRKS